MTEQLQMTESHFIAFLQHAIGSELSHTVTMFSIFGGSSFMSIFYFPLVYNIDGAIGCQMIWLTCVTEWLNTVLKWTFHGHRPYWWVAEHGGPALQQFYRTCETAPGNPSGHMMFSVAVSSTMLNTFCLKARLNKFATDWLTVLHSLCILMIAVSRMYLAAHFPHQIIFGTIAGYYVAQYFECVDTRRMRTMHYLLVTSVMLAIGGIMFITMTIFEIDVTWSVAKACQFCTVPNAIRHKHNVWADFIRHSCTLLGVGIGLWATGDKAFWSIRTPTYLRVVGSLLSIVLAQLTAHHIHISHSEPFMFYSTVAAKASGTAFVIIVIANGCRRLGKRLGRNCQ